MKDRIARRDFLLRAGGLPFLPALLASESARWTGKRSLILLWMDGGMSQLDTLDCKPEAKPDIRGELGSIRTPLEDVFLSEHLPRLARTLDKCVLIRSLTSGEGNHGRASHYMLSGHRPSPVLVHPSLGSWLGLDAKTAALPAYVAIPSAPAFGKQGFLGPERLPFELGVDPSRRLGVPNLRAPEERARALELLELKDRLDGEARSAAEEARDRLLAKARALSEDPDARSAFDLEREKPELRARYGGHRLGQSCLLARRLVEAGVRTVLVRETGWDHHQNIKQALTRGFPPKLPALDQALSTLILDLEARGLDERVLVLLASEFGRTPRLNPRGGRDHWPRASSCLLYGAGLRRGVVLGRTDPRGEEPSEHPLSPADLHATLLAALEVPSDRALQTASGRPIPVLERGAKPAREVLAP